MENNNSLNRRHFIKLSAGVAAATTISAAGWGITEIMVEEETASSWHKSVCRFCGTGCGVMIGMRNKKIVKITGDKEAHNKGVICIKGSMLAQISNLPNRLTEPLIRKNGKLTPASWDEAMSLMASKFKSALEAHGPESIAYYGSGQLYCEESYTANKLFKAGFGSNNVDGNPRLCMASAAIGYTQTFGKDEPPGAYEDIDYADCFFLVGSNTYEAHPPLFERIMINKKKNKNTKIIVVDPRRTETAKKADLHLAIKPGTDMLLFNAMAYEFLKNNWIDQTFLSNHTKFVKGKEVVDLKTYKEFLEDYQPEIVATELGISVDQIKHCAFLFAKSKATTSLWTMGINQRVQGVFLNNTLNSLHLLTGQILKPGATPLSLTGQCNACGGVRDTGSLAHILPNGRLIKKPEHRAQMEKIWGLSEGKINPKPGYDAVNLFRAMEEDKVKACLVMCTNPAQSLPNISRYKEAMKKPFLVVSEIFETETTQYADVVLPAAFYTEKQGVYGQTERRLQLVEKLLDPPGQARSDFDILVDFANRMGQQKIISYKTVDEAWNEWRKVSSHSVYNFEGVTYERLKKERGIQWPCPTEDHPGTVRRYIKGDPFVKNGDIQFYGKPDNKAVIFLRPYIPSPEKLNDDFPLFLTTGRVLEQWHTGTMTDKINETNKGSGKGRFMIHPKDAVTYNIKDRSIAEVESQFGKIKGLFEISENETPGVIFASFYDPKFLVNKIVADNFDPISKEPEYKVTAVKINSIS